jgi:glycosyltransferase involved in cell wall biosynthesis
MAGRVLQVGFVIDGQLPRWPRVWQWVRGCPSDSAVGQMRFGWIARALHAEPSRRVRYSLFRPWQRYDAVIFLKSMSAASQQLAASLRARGTRVLFDVNVDYFTPAEGTFYYRGMAPTPAQTADARRMAELSDALIADSSHLGKVCALHHRNVRWISDNVDLRFAPQYRPWKPGAKLDLLWSGESVKLFELLRIEEVLRKFASRIRLVLVTNDLAALDRWFDPWKTRFESLLAAIEHDIIPFRSVGELKKIYGSGGVFISPRFLDNTYNWGHTEWKIALPMACGRVALGSPLPSYREVAARSGGAGLRLCEDDASWSAALDEMLAGRFDFAAEEDAAREVVKKHYSTPVVAAAHHDYVADVCAAGR